MYDWKELPDHSRVWVYQAERRLTDDEVEMILEKAEKFINGWSAHGAALRASVNVFYNTFLVLFVDEKHAMATGCSIDKSVHFVQGLSREMDINFMDRMTVAQRTEDGVELCSMEEFESKLKQGDASGDTIVFNNVVGTIGDFKQHWEIPVKESWHSRLLP